MNEITDVNSKGVAYPIKVNEEELKNRVDPLSFDVLRKAATEAASLGSTPTAKLLVFINVKRVLQSCLDLTQNFIPDAVGHLFMNQPKRMRLN